MTHVQPRSRLRKERASGSGAGEEIVETPSVD
jgi:hypothetical protein